ncbi:MAG: DUF523 domain-containing protein [Candidatus Heimdallarchaeota archaeon]|nr:DUF523 domain-containing protein [Candidatus Heimdallarchaeota archaeon]
MIISACLIGVNCVYDGTNNKTEQILALQKRYLLIPLCPEQLGGLPTPRIPACIVKGTGKEVIKGEGFLTNRRGKDVTANFLKGAKESLTIARFVNAKLAILKERSPSCGVHEIYNREPNTKKDRKVKGCGVTTACFLQEGIKVISNEKLLKDKGVLNNFE